MSELRRIRQPRAFPGLVLLVGAALVLSACGQSSANQPTPMPTATSPSPAVSGFQVLYTDAVSAGRPIQLY